MSDEIQFDDSVPASGSEPDADPTCRELLEIAREAVEIISMMQVSAEWTSTYVRLRSEGGGIALDDDGRKICARMIQWFEELCSIESELSIFATPEAMRPLVKCRVREKIMDPLTPPERMKEIVCNVVDAWGVQLCQDPEDPIEINSFETGDGEPLPFETILDRLVNFSFDRYPIEREINRDCELIAAESRAALESVRNVDRDTAGRVYTCREITAIAKDMGLRDHTALGKRLRMQRCRAKKLGKAFELTRETVLRICPELRAGIEKH